MKSLRPWIWVLAAATTQGVYADGGLEVYRQGEYFRAGNLLLQSSTKDPVADFYLGRMRLYGYGELKNNALALRYFTQAGEKGFLPAQNLMARYGLAEKNLESALYWFKKAADANDVEAQMYCAAAYIFGVGVKKNPEAAKKYYIAAAKNGNSIAQYTLAENFLDSKQMANKKLGLIWLMKAVSQKNPQAQIKLAELYSQGEMVEPDLTKASVLIDSAVQQGYAPALYYRGKLAQQQNDMNSAKKWYLKAAEHNVAQAKIALAEYYLDTKSAHYEPHTGFLWMLKASEEGSPEAMLALAKIYQEGQVLVKNEQLAKAWQQKAGNVNPKDNLIKVLHWLTLNSNSNLNTTEYRLGGILGAWTNPDALKENNYNQFPQMNLVTRDTLYKPGFVMVDPDQIAMNEYYDALIKSLNVSRQFPIDFPRYALDTHQVTLPEHSFEPDSSRTTLDAESNILEKILTDIKEKYAVKKPPFEQIYERAVLGDPTAQFIVGQMYQTGTGVEKNISTAIHFYQLATDQKDLRAEYNLGLLYVDGKDSAPDYIKGTQLLRDSAFKGNSKAQYVLAQILESGLKDATGKSVIPADSGQSLAFYHLSAANNFGPAQYRLAELLVGKQHDDVSVAAQQKRNQLIKRLYSSAVTKGIRQAALPLAFFNAMDSDPQKQAQAFLVAKQEAEKGNGQAALLLGILYDRGIATPENQAEALKWYQLASINPVSTFILGTYYTKGKGVPKDLEKGKILLQQAAQGGFSYASLNLAILKHQKGEAFLNDLNQALDSGNSRAGLLLADYFLSGNDQQNMQRSRELYQQFAQKGDKEAQLKLAYMFEQGLGGEPNLPYAEAWYSMAAQQGQPVAQYLLGRLYQLGRTSTYPNYAEAKKWYESAKHHYAPAAVALGFIYETVDDDYPQAYEAYQLASSHQDPTGLYDLALMFEKGKGRPVNYLKAKDFYSQAAHLGHSQAMAQLAGIYFAGYAGGRNEEEALYWYKKAAALGDPDALYQLGLLSETGVSLVQDYGQALTYYQESAAKGNEKATLALARMYQYGLGVTKNLGEALNLYKKLAARDNAYAQYQLATLYYETKGLGGVEGKHWLQLAAKNGSVQAIKTLQWKEAQSQNRLSYIESVPVVKASVSSGQPADLMYLDAMNHWNRGDKETSQQILQQIRAQFPHYMPAKRMYEVLVSETNPLSLAKT